ncbi:MAG: NTP transferase domain-containing protein [Wenzhouxiangella sp.]
MNSAREAKIDVILLAGDRGPDDPLARRAGVIGKALVPVAGRPLLETVLRVLLSWPKLGRIILVAPAHADYAAIVARVAAHRADALVCIEPAASISASVQAGIAASQGDWRLVLTADHALLDTAWLDALLAQTQAEEDTEILVGLADWHRVMARFPGSRRTRYRFRDYAICGTNLFAMREPGASRLLKVWREVEQQRKKPWRIISLLGWHNLAAYLAGRLRLDDAFAALSRRLAIPIRPLLLDDPLTAVDVDSLADHALVEQVLLERERATC